MAYADSLIGGVSTSLSDPAPYSDGLIGGVSATLADPDLPWGDGLIGGVSTALSDPVVAAPFRASGGNIYSLDWALDETPVRRWYVATDGALTPLVDRLPPAWTPPLAVVAGAATLGTTSYAIPSTGTVIYVSTTGSDGNPGSAGSPKATLAGAVAVTGGSGTIIVRGGVYEVASMTTIPSGGSGLTIQAYPGEAVWFDGSVVKTGWSYASSKWTASYTPLSLITLSGQWGSDDNPDAVQVADQVWIDGVRQTAIADNTTPTAGQFSVNRGSGTISIGSDPTGKTVRVSRTTNLALMVSPTSWLGVGVRRFSPTAVEWAGAAIYSADQDKIAGSTIENCIFEQISTTAINWSDNTGVTIRSSTIQDCGHAGIQFGGGTALFTRNLLRRINFQKWRAEPTTGAVKIARADQFEVSHNYVADVYGAMGIWLDVSNTRFTVVGNRVVGAAGTLGKAMQIGIHVEESDGGKYDGVQYRSIVAANTVSGATSSVRLLCSGYVDVVNNTLSGADTVGGAIYAQQDRNKNSGTNPLNRTQEQCPWWTVNNRLVNNRIGDSRRQIFLTGNYSSWPIAGMDYFNQISGNWFEPVTGSGQFAVIMDRSNAYRQPATLAAMKALTTIGDTSGIGVNAQGSTVPDASTVAVPATTEWANAAGIPIGWQAIGNPLNPPIPAS